MVREVRCVKSAFDEISFPSPEGGIVTVVYPITFKPVDVASHPALTDERVRRIIAEAAKDLGLSYRQDGRTLARDSLAGTVPDGEQSTGDRDGPQVEQMWLSEINFDGRLVSAVV